MVQAYQKTSASQRPSDTKIYFYATGTCIIPHAVFDKHENCFLILFISLPEVLHRHPLDDSWDRTVTCKSYLYLFFCPEAKKEKKLRNSSTFFFRHIQFLVVWSFFSLKHTKWNLWCHILLQSETITWQSMPTVFHCLCEKAFYSNFPFKNKSGKPPHLTLHQIQGITNAN